MKLSELYKPLHISHQSFDEPVHYLSAFLQDSLCSVTSMHLDESAFVFSFSLNRFCWELVDQYEELQSYYRVHTAFKISKVCGVMKKNFHQADQVRMLNLLSVSFSVESDMTSIRFFFSGGIELDVRVDQCDLYVNDYAQPWPTQNKPTHIHEHLELLAV